MKHTARILVFLLTFSMPGLAAEIPEKLDEAQGYKLVTIATGLKTDTGFQDNVSPFFFYQLWKTHEGTKGWYAVNPWTGDVWDVWAAPHCKHLTNPALKQEQEQIKKRFSKDELKEYKRLSELAPYPIKDGLQYCGLPVKKHLPQESQ